MSMHTLVSMHTIDLMFHDLDTEMDMYTNEQKLKTNNFFIIQPVQLFPEKMDLTVLCHLAWIGATKKVLDLVILEFPITLLDGKALKQAICFKDEKLTEYLSVEMLRIMQYQVPLGNISLVGKALLEKCNKFVVMRLCMLEQDSGLRRYKLPKINVDFDDERFFKWSG